jgi:RHS repeat-associated protein
VKHSYSTGQWQYPMYNALGQRVQDYQGAGTDSATLTYPVDITGRRTGTWDQWPAQNWTGWDVYWARVAGQHISMGGTYSWLAHADAIDSTTMVTDQTGTPVWDQVFGPWGQIWQQTGTRPWFVFAGLRWPVNDPLKPSATREYSGNVFRWMTPDTFGGHLEDPQTLNKYAYVRNNPTSLNDPSGRDIWLKCDEGSDKSHCHGGYYGTWDSKHKHFTRTHLAGDRQSIAKLGPNGIEVNYKGGTYTGVWDTHSNDQNPVLVSGGGALKSFVAEVNGGCRNSSCQASFILGEAGSTLSNFRVASASAVEKALLAAGSGYRRQAGIDFLDSSFLGSHPGAVNFRGYSPDQPGGLPSTHVPWYPSPDWQGAGHVDSPYPYDDLFDFSRHGWSWVKSGVPQ